MAGFTHDLHAIIDGQKKPELLVPTPQTNALLDTVSVYRSTVTPIRRLPVELLTEVFVFCLPDDTFIRPCPKSAPLLLTRVCGSWRDLALSVPRLWSSIYINMSFKLSPQNITTLASRLGAWLTHSAQHYLTIKLFIDVDQKEPLRTVFVQEAIEVIKILFLHVVQWRHINWDIQTPEVLTPSEPYTAAIGSTALHTLHINVLENMSDDLSALLNTIMGHSPQLRNYSYHNYIPTFSRCILEPPWALLTHVNLGYFEIPVDVLEVFLVARSLVKCRLDFGMVVEDHLDSTPQAIISNQSLQILVVETGAALRSVMNYLSLPGLRELVMYLDLPLSTANDVLPEWPQSSFSGFIARSHCLLESLTFQTIGLSADDLLACLELTSSSLNSLSIADEDGTKTITDAVLSRLLYTTASDGTASCLCPRLATLIVIGCCNCSDGAFAAMIESRWKPGDEAFGGTDSQFPCIKKVHVDDGLPRGDKLQLQVLAEEGLDVTFLPL